MSDKAVVLSADWTGLQLDASKSAPMEICVWHDHGQCCAQSMLSNTAEDLCRLDKVEADAQALLRCDHNQRS